MKKIILIIGILALLVSCDMPNNDSSNTDVSNQTDTTSETTNKEDETPSSTEDDSFESEEEIKEDNTSENEETEEDTTSETPSPIEDDSSESEETNYSNEFIVSSDVTWEEVYGDYVSYVHYNNNDDDTQRITYKVCRDASTKEFSCLKKENLKVNPSNTSKIVINLTVYFMENDELKFISSSTSILIENVRINKENKEVHIYLIDKN